MIKKILKFAALVLIIAAAGILALAAMKPDYFRVERTTNIQAPAEKIFPHINVMQNWTAWSPWEKLDPAMRRTYTGPTSGVGSKYSWEGNKNIGVGSTEIIESMPPSKLVMNLDFIKPFEAHNVVEFTLVSKGENSTDVTWAMHGPQPFFAKIMSVILNCDKMVGKEFEGGLASLKKVSES